MFNKPTPSIFKQARHRPCGIFDFGKAKVAGVSYFNPSIVERPDGTWLVARRSKNDSNFPYGINDLMVFKLDGITPITGKQVKIFKNFSGEHFEDPRVIYNDGITYIGACNFIWGKKGWTGAHQILCTVSDDWNSTGKYHPVYGGNGSEIGRVTRHEKSWLWFFHEGKMHMVYQANPHTVIEFDSISPVVVHKTESDLKWKYGEVRGGTPPVLVDGEYWTFFHSSLPHKICTKQYHIGAYSFEAHPPFRITRITPKPVLSGSMEMCWNPGKPACVFPGGAIIKNMEWLVVFGVNDLECGWIKIQHDELARSTRKVLAIDTMAQKEQLQPA